MKEKLLNIMRRNGWKVLDATYYDFDGKIYASQGEYYIVIKRLGLTNMYEVKINGKIHNMYIMDFIDWMVNVE